MSRRKMEGLRVLLTGASSGIGWHLAMELARRGCQLVVTARRADRLEVLCQSIAKKGGRAVAVPGDITDRDHRLKLISQSLQEMGGVDSLVNCAGVGAMGRFETSDPERLRSLFEVNFFSLVEMSRLAIPVLRSGRDPIIVNVGSVLGHRAVPLKSGYCASKFAVHGFSDSLRAELADDGIDVLLASPSTTDSDFFDSVVEDLDGRDWKGRKAMSPERVAGIIARSMRMGKHEVIISLGGIVLVWLDRISPPLANYLIARFGK